MNKLQALLTRTLLFFALGMPLSTQADEIEFFRIGTGGIGGTYYPIGGTIAGGLSAPPGARECEDGGHCGVPGLIAIAQSTTASVFNNSAVQFGHLEAGLAAADVTRSMYLGEDEFEGKPFEKLRILANLYPENLHLVLSKDSNISSIADLKNKRVGIAQAGSGTQVAVLQLLEQWNITRDNIFEAELSHTRSAERLAEGSLDAYFYIAGWPVAAISKLASGEGMELYDFSETDLATISATIPAFASSVIPAGVYDGVDYEVTTPAVSALLVVSSDLSEELVYELTKALWNDSTKRLFAVGHPKGELITSSTALDGLESIGVPLHVGAQKYYSELGLLK